MFLLASFLLTFPSNIFEVVSTKIFFKILKGHCIFIGQLNFILDIIN